jgi:hypothetical protein
MTYAIKLVLVVSFEVQLFNTRKSRKTKHDSMGASYANNDGATQANVKGTPIPLLTKGEVEA